MISIIYNNSSKSKFVCMCTYATYYLVTQNATLHQMHFHGNNSVIIIIDFHDWKTIEETALTGPQCQWMSMEIHTRWGGGYQAVITTLLIVIVM